MHPCRRLLSYGMSCTILLNSIALAAPPAYPIKVKHNTRSLVDQNERPFLLHGDAAWSLLVALDKTETEEYLEDRRLKGFNSIIVNLIEHKFQGPTNRDGQGPFLTPGDFSTPNERYFWHVDWVIKTAARKGIQLLIAPAYLGYEGKDEGWYEEVVANGPTKARTYGRFLGNRYKAFDNIVWLHGCDRVPGKALESVRAIALGIKEFDNRHLHTAQGAPEQSALDIYSSEPWLDFNSIYTYRLVHRMALKARSRNPVMPFILIESHYEGEHDSTPQWIRRQAYWAVLSGASGQIMGNRPLWRFDPGWRAALNSPGSQSMVHLKSLFESRAWHRLIPDHDHQVVIEGYGNISGMDYVAASATGDGGTVIAYLPTSQKITIDMSKISGKQSAAWWYDPRTGKTYPAGRYPNRGVTHFTPPTNDDWVLVLDDASRNVSTPTTIPAR